MLRSDWVRASSAKIHFGCNQNDRSISTHLSYLITPLSDIVKRVSVIDRDADHEAVCFIVYNRAVRAKIRVSASIVNYQINLLAPQIFGSLEDVEHCGLVIVRENLLLVVNDQARLTDGCVTDKD